ncbi:NUDIX domain-containing protein [Aquimarina sp. AU474]|uniref:NUDIX hydrolase n=1 Tax=Aquimarina sp. AU474 TaxID=2108529 RepID=UPI000D693C20|nr:NUDIX domain-containing protein [Aquimarina sp. AU474]
MPDELIDILDHTGNPTGEVRLKSDVHRLGLLHASVHIWFYTKKGELLIQKRAEDKDTYPNLWDVSVAGHIAAGETPKNSALREITEEIGLTINIEDLLFIGTYLAKKIPTPFILDNEIHHIYMTPLKVPLTSLQLQQEEVADITLIKIDELIKALSNHNKAKKYVPHDKKYFEMILKEIENRLS